MCTISDHVIHQRNDPRVVELDSERSGIVNRNSHRFVHWLRCILFPARGSRTFDCADNNHKRELESRANFVDSFVLSSNASILRESGGGGELQVEKNSNRCKRRSKSSDSEEGLMALDQLYAIKPNKHLRLRYRVPRKHRIEYRVEASLPVTTFVLDEDGLEEYNKKGSDVYSYYGGFSHRKHHAEKVDIPFDGFWYLIIQNDSDTVPVAITYEVLA
jgi:hypothetical protein